MIIKLPVIKTTLLITILLIVASVILVYVKIHNVEQELDKANKENDKQYALLQNKLNYQNSLLTPTFDASSNLLIFPEIGIQLPFNEITKTLRYTHDSGQYGYTRITSTLVVDHQERQIGCSELAIIDFDNNGPISPWAQDSGSVKLDDIRTMYVTTPVAYENNEASTLACASEVWTNITPEKVAEELKKAKAL